MAAVQQSFTDEPLPEAVVFDADFVVSALSEQEEFHATCRHFASRLLRSGVTVFYSQLLRIEFLSAWQNALRRRGIPKDLMPQPRLLEDRAAERSAIYAMADDYLLTFLRSFQSAEVRLSSPLQDVAREYIAVYDLKPMDACLVATAVRSGADNIVSLDNDFTKVDGIHLWNDNIPAKRQAARRRKRS